MNKNTFRTVKLEKGEMHIYDGGAVRLHAYKTNDPIDNEVFIVEKDGRAVLLESPCFYDNIRELTAYLKDMRVEGMLVAYHAAGGSFLPTCPKYATQSAKDYAEAGGGKALIDGFSAAFGAAFDASVHTVTNLVGAGRVCIRGIDFLLRPTADAFDVEIPEINAVYTHYARTRLPLHRGGAGPRRQHHRGAAGGHRPGVRPDSDLPLHAGGPQGRADENRLPRIAQAARRRLHGRRGLQGRDAEAVSVVQRAELFGYDGGLFLRLRRRLSGRKGGIRA